MEDLEKKIDISKESDYISIFETNYDINELLEIVNFFQYKVANEKDSPLSLKLDSTLSDSQKDILYDTLIQSVHGDYNDFLFNGFLRNGIKEIRIMGLSDNTLNCDKIKGFFHQNNPKTCKKNQHKLDSLFKHIRNSFAHGRIAENNSYLILEDKNKELTGRLIITFSALLLWKKEIELYLKQINDEDNHVNIQM